MSKHGVLFYLHAKFGAICGEREKKASAILSAIFQNFCMPKSNNAISAEFICVLF